MEKQEAIDYLNNLQPGMFCTVNLPLYGNEVIPITAMYKGQQQVVTMNQVISDLNTEFMNKITQIQKEFVKTNLLGNERGIIYQR